MNREKVLNSPDKERREKERNVSYYVKFSLEP